MNSDELKERTLNFGIRVMKMAEKLPASQAGTIVSNQIIRSAFSIGANYRAACRAKSSRDFVNKLKIVLEEADETSYWMQIIVRSDLINFDKMKDIMKESDELTAIFAAALITSQKKLEKSKI